MATPPGGAPPPLPMAGLTPPDAPAVPDDGNPDGPIIIPASTVSKLNLPDLTPGSSALATVRVTIGGTPEAPTAEISAVGEIRPDDPGADLTNLSNDSEMAPPDLGVSAGGEGAFEGGESPDETDGVPQDDPYKSLGFKPKMPKKKAVSAKDVFGED